MEKRGKAIRAFMPNNFCAPKVPPELSAGLIEEFLILLILSPILLQRQNATRWSAGGDPVLAGGQ
ncbi:hypothetical protein [Pedobacter westerhofensis]|uniref:hypothetical protein n=1 Tax=Pedobacter westerhofensis TaxID=425512 RepID=UPI0011573DFF|nr:hypothetical protein [Pedobacter westerhofensis]